MPTTESKRAQYMRGDITFNQYYGALVELLGEDALRRLLPIDRTPTGWRELLAEDEHLNNVSLRKWDAEHANVIQLVRRTGLGERVAITGSGGWSLSDSVCTLKTTARRYAAG